MSNQMKENRAKVSCGTTISFEFLFSFCSLTLKNRTLEVWCSFLAEIRFFSLY